MPFLPFILLITNSKSSVDVLSSCSYDAKIRVMADQPRPVIVGVGDIKDSSTDLLDVEEPKYLILQAIHAAARDTNLPPYASEHLLSEIDSIDVVRTWTWPYDDLAGDLAQEIRAKPKHKITTCRHGGDQPAKLIDEAARRISYSQSKVAVVAGGEALASLSTYMNKKGSPPPHWTPTNEGMDTIFAHEREQYQKGLGASHGIGAPIQVYPLYENALRAHRGQLISQNHSESAQMYSDFAETASHNEYAWSGGKPCEHEETIRTLSKRNRMICFPYPLLMTAFNNVNLSAACILTSTEYARELGIPESQWVYVRGGAGTRDSEEFWLRPNFHTSPSISRSLDAALESSKLTASEIDAYDFYSCFPVVPKLACIHLGLPSVSPYKKPISLLGGLTFFGGAGNNYSTHSITHMTRFLRERKGKNGLVLANGGVVTYQHSLCLSTLPPSTEDVYPERNLIPENCTSLDTSAIDEDPHGKAVVETYTVDFERNGKPVLGHVVGKLICNGKRFLANHANEKTLMDLCSSTTEPIGRKGNVKAGENGRNLFTFEYGALL